IELPLRRSIRCPKSCQLATTVSRDHQPSRNIRTLRSPIGRRFLRPPKFRKTRVNRKDIPCAFRAVFEQKEERVTRKHGSAHRLGLNRYFGLGCSRLSFQTINVIVTCTNEQRLVLQDQRRGWLSRQLSLPHNLSRSSIERVDDSIKPRNI